MRAPLMTILGELVLASAMLPCLAAAADADKDRIELAPVPELAFVAGLPETVQLGAFVLDPANRWTPGDLRRSSGWTSRVTTRLVVARSGQPPEGFRYDGRTGELRYTGGPAGDQAVRLEVGSVAQEFRIRVLTPTHVFGEAAAAIDAKQKWKASICPADFKLCRKQFKVGNDDNAPLVLYIAPGHYSSDFFLGTKPYVYVLGDPDNRPELSGDSLDLGKFVLWQVRNLRLNGTRIGSGSANTGQPSWAIVSNVEQCCETGDRNGISNPNGLTVQPWRWTLWSVESRGMGSPGNTVHAAYIEGRPRSTLEVINSRFLGTRGSSAIKTTMQEVAIRHSLFSVSETPGDLATGGLMHTPVDVPAVSRLTLYGNEFQLWRGPTAGTRPGRQGVQSGAVYLRLRKPGLRGSDTPAYPDQSWSPPLTSQATASSPGTGWDAGPATFVSDDFWKAVRRTPATDPANPLTFKHYLGFNRFVQQPGSLPVTVLRDDGTHPAEPVAQFGPGRPLRTHPAWVERSVSFLYGNEYAGMEGGPRLELDSSENMKDPEPGAKWPRKQEEEFPHAVQLKGALPDWFAL